MLRTLLAAIAACASPSRNTRATNWQGSGDRADYDRVSGEMLGFVAEIRVSAVLSYTSGGSV